MTARVTPYEALLQPLETVAWPHISDEAEQRGTDTLRGEDLLEPGLRLGPAEVAVLAANGPDLATVALRPHLIWGPGDPHLVPRVLARAREGKLRRIGSRPVRVDVTYIDNAADALATLAVADGIVVRPEVAQGIAESDALMRGVGVSSA